MSCVLNIDCNLAPERFDVGVFLLVAQLVQEIDLQMCTIDVAVKIQQVDFQTRLRDVGDGRTHAQARRTRQRLRAQAMHFDGEYPRERRAIVLHQHIGRRKTQFAADAVAGDYAAADAVRTPQQALCALHVARGQRLAHRGARDPHAICHHAPHRVHFESTTAGSLLQHRKITGASGAKAKIVADQYPARRESAMQDALDKILRRGFREFEIEPADVHALDAELRQQFELLAQGSQPGGCFVGGEEFAWMRLERHHARRNAKPARRVGETREHRLVADMHTVEIADGQRNRATGIRQQSAENTH